ncbi:putative serine protease PepD [Brevibacterium sanguinis]|uniref:Serine protease PepD n=2 Tax=Brevibacterium TaxID=1696 RepID=A0ABX9GQC5_9MICO|nr:MULTISPECIES: trypsin-like peptidase domain-containing protein [Brevibacterium]RBP65523.1 putative serine protease PepD [Brevibacterium sanguinis]RBP72157.1 putative serine protease PepD [Brevibacterium celere]
MSSNDDSGTTPDGGRSEDRNGVPPQRGRHGEPAQRTFPDNGSRGRSEVPRTFGSDSPHGPGRVSPPVAPPARGYSQSPQSTPPYAQNGPSSQQNSPSSQQDGQSFQQGSSPYQQDGPPYRQDTRQPQPNASPSAQDPQHGTGSASPHGAGPTHGSGPSPTAGQPRIDPTYAHSPVDSASGHGYGYPGSEGSSGDGGQSSPYAAPPGYPPTAPPRRAKKGPGWGATIAIAAIAALLGGGAAFGGSYAVTSMQDEPNRQVAEQTIETPDWTEVAKKTSQSVVSIQAASGGQVVALGSGSLYDDQGHVVTNNHVVAPADTPDGELNVTMKNGASIRAEIVGRDPSTDIAIIKLEQVPDGVTPLPVGESADLQVGDPVMALGNPLGLADTVTTGIVSALDRPVSTENIGEDVSAQEREMTITNAIQTDAAINPGNSGGPLVDGNGKFIGVNSAAASLSQPGESGQSGSIGIGFAIPSAQAVMIADQLIATGEAKHPFLGITLTDGQVNSAGITRGSAKVQSVQNGSPAAAAGFQAGDDIIAVGGSTVNNAIGLRALVRAQPVQQPVEFTVIRGGQEQTLTATLVLQ